MRVLVVEQYEAIRTLLETALRQGGYEVVSASSGRAAIEAVESDRFSCVVVGSPVSVHSGSDNLFLEYVERHSPDWRRRLVVITTYVESERLLSLAARLRVSAVLAKPFTPGDLLEAVAACSAGGEEPTRWIGIPSSLVANATAGALA